MCNTMINELKKCQVEILMELDRICKKYNLYYVAAWGTALGAVRHKGFIPWDDDIDVHMTYKDYKKLEELAKDELGEKFYFQSRKNNPQNFIPWNRIGLKNTTSIDKNLAHIHADWGICIDIFPILPLGDNEKEIKKNMKSVRKINKWCLKYLMLGTADQYTGIEYWKRKVHGCVPDFFSVRIVNYYLDKLGKMEDAKKKYCISTTSAIFETAWFEEVIYVPFEDIKIPLMKEYDKYLSKAYGNYMQIPKEEERIAHVNENIILKFDEPYQKYYK